MNRASLRRMARSVAIRAIDSGFVGVFATILAYFDKRRGLYLRGRVLDIRHRHDDHTDFWHNAAIRIPRAPEFLRSNIHAALRAGRTSEAEAGLDLLLRAHRVEAADSKFVVGLSYIYDRRGDRSAVRILVKKFLKSLSGKMDFRIAAVSLSRLLFAHFPRKLSRNIGGLSDRYRQQFLKMLGRSQVRNGPKSLLRRVALCEERLAEKSPLALFDTDISREQCETFIQLVRNKLAAREPFSFVRAGDGEAACLPYEPHLSSLARGDAIDRERIWWGRSLDAGQRSHFAALVSRAIWGADCIGVPPISRFLRELQLAKEDSLEGGLTGRGLRSILHAAENYEEFRPHGMSVPAFASCHLHQDLERWNLYPALFEGVRDVVILSCHPGLADAIGQRFGVAAAGNILLPPDRVSDPKLKERTGERRDLPEMLEEVEKGLGDLPKNRLVLVGAGYLGKWLVDVARARGGVALDVGSIFDYWVGLTTRSYLDLNSA